MKINLAEIDRENFLVSERDFYGEKVYLVGPKHEGATYTKETLHFRSSVWDANGELISASFKKFFNWGEQSALIPEPTDVTKCVFPEKCDGSTLIVSKHNGNLMARTRGTTDASKMELAGKDIELLMQKYPNAFHNILTNSERASVIYEWVTPNNKIIIDYGSEPDLFLIGVIWHSDYSMAKQSVLNCFANDIHVKRPTVYTFASLEDMLSNVKVFKGKEGVVVYFNDEQDIKKVKGDDYLRIHRLKYSCSVSDILDRFLAEGMPTREALLDGIEKEFDFECRQILVPLVDQVYAAVAEYNERIQSSENIAKTLVGLTRKEQAAIIVKNHRDLSGFIFSALDKRKAPQVEERKIILEIIKGKR